MSTDELNFEYLQNIHVHVLFLASRIIVGICMCERIYLHYAQKNNRQISI